MKIYTKKGDQGFTSIINGEKVLKCALIIEVLGGIDELNSLLGIVVSLENNTNTAEAIKSRLIEIQEWLMQISAEIADLKASDTGLGSAGSVKSNAENNVENNVESNLTQTAKGSKIQKHVIFMLEKDIDYFSSKIPSLNSFIIPGGSVQGSFLFYARAVCRRVERQVVAFKKCRQGLLHKEFLAFFNRLGDWLFILARYVNYLEVSSELIWSGTSSKKK